MNKWLRRAVGTVGIAGGVWLLGSGTAHADAATQAFDQPHLPDLSSLFTPAGGPNNLGLALDNPVTEAVTGALPAGPVSFSHGATQDPAAGIGTDAAQQPALGLLDALPVTDVLPLGDLGALPGGAGPEGRALPGGAGPEGRALPGGAGPEGRALSTGAGPEDLSGLPLLGGLLPLGGFEPGDLPIAGTLTRAVPLDAAPVPALGSLTQVVPLDALEQPGDAMAPAGGLTDSLPVLDSLTGGGSEDLPIGGGVPVVGALLGGNLIDGLPVVGPLLGGLVNSALPGSGGTQTESLPVVDTLPVVGPLLGGDSGLPVLGSLLGGTGHESLPIFDSLPLVSGLL